MSATAPAATDRLPLRTKLAFGIGSSAESIAIYAVLTYVLLFYNLLARFTKSPEWTARQIEAYEHGEVAGKPSPAE